MSIEPSQSVAVRAVVDGHCSPQCVFGREDSKECECRCRNTYHGALRFGLELDLLQEEAQRPLIRVFVQVFDSEGAFKHQGQIAAHAGGDVYLVQWFSFLSGDECWSTLHSLSEMLEGGWRFFDDPEQWRESCEEHSEAAVRRARWHAEEAEIS